MSEQARAGQGAPEADGRRRMTWLYVRVLVVQAAALLALWVLQSVFGTI